MGDVLTPTGGVSMSATGVVISTGGSPIFPVGMESSSNGWSAGVGVVSTSTSTDGTVTAGAGTSRLSVGAAFVTAGVFNSTATEEDETGSTGVTGATAVTLAGVV